MAARTPLIRNLIVREMATRLIASQNGRPSRCNSVGNFHGCHDHRIPLGIKRNVSPFAVHVILCFIRYSPHVLCVMGWRVLNRSLTSSQNKLSIHVRILSHIPRLCGICDNILTWIRIGYRIYSLWRFITAHITITSF
jgi:hypothetical protein